MKVLGYLIREIIYLAVALGVACILMPPLHTWVVQRTQIGGGDGAAPPELLPLYQSYMAQWPEPLLVFEIALPWLLFMLVRTLFGDGRGAPVGQQDTGIDRGGEPRALNEQVQALIEQGADINRQDERGYTLLQRAVQQGESSVVELLLDNGADLDVRDPESDWAPLHHAAETGNPGLCELLIRYGADPDATTATNDTALHLAAARGQLEVLEVLLKYRARTDCRNDAGVTPEQLARQHPEIIELLHSHASQIWPYLKIPDA